MNSRIAELAGVERLLNETYRQLRVDGRAYAWAAAATARDAVADLITQLLRDDGTLAEDEEWAPDGAGPRPRVVDGRIDEPGSITSD